MLLLDRCDRNTPILVAGSIEDWVRRHRQTREVLQRQRFVRLAILFDRWIQCAGAVRRRVEGDPSVAWKVDFRPGVGVTVADRIGSALQILVRLVDHETTASRAGMCSSRSITAIAEAW